MHHRSPFLASAAALALASLGAACAHAPRPHPQHESRADELPVRAAPIAPSSADEPATRASPDPRADVVRRLAEEGLARGRAFEMLRELTRIAPLRLSGSDGAAAAVRWGEERLRAIGAQNVRLEPCTVPRWIRGDVEHLSVVEPADARDTPLPILALGGSVATPPGGVEAELVVVRRFEELVELGERARGKIVLFNRPMDPARLDPFEAYGGAVDQRSRGAVEAARAGAVGAIVRSMTLATDDYPHTGAMRYHDELARVPVAAVSTAGADRLAALAARGPVRVRLELACRREEDVPSFNVVGELVGREHPNEIVLISGHLDAWDVGEGAHDDGAGCVQVMEALRLLRELGLTPRRTIRVVLYMNEENGLQGGRAYARTHADELARHVLALESDRGGFAPRGFSVNDDGEVRRRLAEIVALCAPLGASELRRGEGGADISVLADSGVPLVEYLPDASRYFDFHHAQRDVLEAVHPRELELGAVCIAALAYAVADAEQPLPRTR
ncbi:MAG: M20/M25/M40 family metallo-hydrolase [Planctomycetota bacterium]